MPAISYTDFSGGLDRRLPQDVQEANRLWVLRNAYITLGKRIKKRPALKLATTGLTGSFGLENVNGRLAVFASKGLTFTPPTGIQMVGLSLPTDYASDSLLGVTYADNFNGFPYVVGYYKTVTTTTKYTFDGHATTLTVEGRAYRHHYVDGSTNTLVTDVNCPPAASVCKAASRVFAIAGEVVRYCVAGNPRDWTTPDDAGFLPVALQQDTKTSCTAVGSFSNSLVVYFPEGCQIWKVAVDPTANELTKRVSGVGSLQPLSLASFASDLMFLSPFGFRSMTVQALTDRIDDTDVGVQIDTLVTDDIDELPDNGLVISAWIPAFGQYWAIFPDGLGSKAWVYTFSRSSKIACWSEYTFPILITAMTTLAGKVYVRTVSDMYELDAERFTDDGTSIPVEIQMAFQNAKSPGVDKQFYGADFVFQGTANVSYKYDPRDGTKESVPQAISGDTAPGVTVPVEIVAASIAPVIRHEADEAFEFTATSLYFQSLAVT